ncbi:hypothetical protein AURDEDRAFT_109600 [Auricularia subglabra TFB-10046 SS5]|nr:hypothetical protein AURDEDRAFT_109600 [Auricularia subglabra TFB-10046 SS5]
MARGKEWSSTSSEEEQEAFLVSQRPPRDAPASPPSRAVTAFVWICVATLALTAANFTLLSARQLRGTLAFGAKPSKRPSIYIGLEKVEPDERWPMPQYLPNYPTLLAQVDSAHPDRVGEHLDVKLSPEVSMIAQFRFHDYGMNDCTFGAWLSPAKMLEDAKSDRTYSVHNNAANVEIWELDADSYDELKLSKLTYITKPKRRNLVAKLSVKAGAAANIGHFGCPTGSLKTYEIVCADADCAMEWKQDNLSPRIAWMVFQYPLKHH